MVTPPTENISVNFVSLGLLKVSGPGAASLLQGQITCDIQEVQSTQSRWGAHCDIKGRVLASFRLFWYQAAYYLLLPKEMLTFLIKDLNKYTVFYKVTLQDVSEQWQINGLSGASIETYLPIDLKESHTAEAVFSSPGIITLKIPDIITRYIQLRDLSVKHESIESFQNPIQKAPESVWHSLDIQAGIAMIHPETRGLFTPHQLRYHCINGVSFTKGCYTGQEIIARMQYLGKLKNQLYRVSGHSHSLPLPGESIKDLQGKEQGTWVMTASTHHTLLDQSSNNTWQALACLQNTVFSQPESLHFEENPINIYNWDN